MLDELMDRYNSLCAKVTHYLGEGAQVKASARARKIANESIKIEYDEMLSILPYEYEENGIFYNKKSVGFGFEIAPKTGADESLVLGLADFLKSKLPAHSMIQFSMLKHPYVGGELAYGFKAFIDKGGVYKSLGERLIAYHSDAVRNGYKNKAGISAYLCDYKCYIFFSIEKIQPLSESIEEIKNSIGSDISVMGFSKKEMTDKEFKEYLQVIFTPIQTSVNWPDIKSQPINGDKFKLDNALVKRSTFEIFEDGVDIDIPDYDGAVGSVRAVCCGLEDVPGRFALWQTPDLFSNIYKVNKSISCPFLLTFTIEALSQDKETTMAKSRAFSLTQANNAINNFMNSRHKDETAEWCDVSEKMSKDESSLFNTNYNLVLYTNPERTNEQVAQAKSCYRDMGFDLVPARCAQWVRLLNSAPFFASEGMFKGLDYLGENRRFTNQNAANLAPIVSDFKGFEKGMLIPTIRNQISFIDTFDGSLINYNYIETGASGSGKSFAELLRIISALANNEKVYVVDIGGSYKHLCELLGGIYVDAASISLNPFTLFDFEGETVIDNEKVKNNVQIRDLLSVMASPNTPLCDIQNRYLLRAACAAWEKKSNKATIDDVIEHLEYMTTLEKYQTDMRLVDVITHLEDYSTKGMYGHIFNGETPLFNENNFVVFELGNLEEEDPMLCKIVTYVMITIIQGYFYNSDRNKRKRCIIDEAWKYITEDDNPIAARFITQGFRTARKHNAGFGVITQGLLDMNATSQAKAIKSSSALSFVYLQLNLNEYIRQYPDDLNEQQINILKSYSEAATCGFSSVMVQYNQGYTFHRVFACPYTRILFSTKGDEYEMKERLIKKGYSIDDAVKAIVEMAEGVSA